MKTFILDGYNVIFAVPELERLTETSLEAARDGLFHFCDRFCRGRGDIRRIHIVFDGKSQFESRTSDSYGYLDVQYSATGQSADEVIVELLDQMKALKSITVVSNDNYVRNHARVYGTNIMHVEEFYGLVHGAAKDSSSAEESLSEAECESITEAYRRHLNL